MYSEYFPSVCDFKKNAPNDLLRAAVFNFDNNLFITQLQHLC